MNNTLTHEQIIQLYVKSTRFSLAFRILIILLMFSYSFTIIYGIATFDNPTNYIDRITKILIMPTIFCTIYGTIKQLIAIFNDERLHIVLKKPILGMRCSYAALKPVEEDIKKFRHINILYIISTFLFSSLIILVLIIVLFDFIHTISRG
jgi:hypothetical protein